MKEKNYGITIIRVLAMLSIILGHYCKMVGINEYQLLSIGVEIFLFISGYLYGSKEIDNKIAWIWQRIKRLMLPYWVVLIVITVVRLAFNYVVPNKLLLFNLFGIQGLNRIFLNLDTGSVQGYGQTWFITILWVCYILMLCFKYNNNMESFVTKRPKFSLVVVVVMQIGLAFLGIQIVYIICYFIGYFVSKRENWLTKRIYIAVTCLFLGLCVARIFFRNVQDGTVLYDQIIARWSFVAMAIWLIMTCLIICNTYKQFSKNIVRMKVWIIMDYLSYPLYLTHFVFLNGSLAVNHYIFNIMGQTVVFICLTVVLALVVVFITDWKNARKIFCVECHSPYKRI